MRVQKAAALLVVSILSLSSFAATDSRELMALKISLMNEQSGKQIKKPATTETDSELVTRESSIGACILAKVAEK